MRFKPQLFENLDPPAIMDAPPLSQDEPIVTPLNEIDYLEHFPAKQEKPSKWILFLGDEQIGKTTFIKRFCEDEEGFHRCYGYSDNTLVITQFLLCDPLHKDRVLTRLIDLQAAEPRKPHYPPEVDMVVFCFAVDKPSSLENVWKVWLPEAREHYPELHRFYLVGLRNDARQAEDVTPVSMEEARRIHKQYKFSGDYMECSDLKNQQEAIDLLGKLIAEVCSPEMPAVLN